MHSANLKPIKLPRLVSRKKKNSFLIKVDLHDHILLWLTNHRIASPQEQTSMASKTITTPFPIPYKIHDQSISNETHSLSHNELDLRRQRIHWQRKRRRIHVRHRSVGRDGDPHHHHHSGHLLLYSLRNPTSISGRRISAATARFRHRCWDRRGHALGLPEATLLQGQFRQQGLNRNVLLHLLGWLQERRRFEASSWLQSHLPSPVHRSLAPTSSHVSAVPDFPFAYAAVYAARWGCAGFCRAAELGRPPEIFLLLILLVVHFQSLQFQSIRNWNLVDSKFIIF